MNTGSIVASATHRLGLPGRFLAILAFILSSGVQAADDFSEVVIFATNSVWINQGTHVNSGDVVVNDASPGPVLNLGVELSIARKAHIFTNVTADSISLAKQGIIDGSVDCNALDSAGVVCTGLSLPVFSQPPVFQQAELRTPPLPPHDPGLGEDIAVGAGLTVTLDAGYYGDITIDKDSTLVFSGGVYNIRSILSVSSTGGPCGVPCRSLEFVAPSDLRIFDRFNTNKDAFIGPAAGSGISAAEIVLYVGGSNFDPGNPASVPVAATVGQGTTIEANIYAAYGTIKIDKESFVTGALLGRDIWIDKDADIDLNTFFFNHPPVAFPKDVNTEGADSVDIIIEGSDPEGEALTFEIHTSPAPPDFLDAPVITPLDPTSARVTYIPFVPAAENPNDFFFTVTDPQGLTSAPAEVRINPPGDPTPPIPPINEVVANDQRCDSIDPPIDCALETIKDTAITLILTGEAPCEDPNCDGTGNNVPLTFSLPSPPTTLALGTLTNLNPGTGVPQRTASVLYTPPAGYTGIDSFDFKVEGDVDNSGGIDPAAEPNPEVATATIELSVQTFIPAPPVVARDQNVSTEMDTPVNINLSGSAGSCDPDCRQAPQQAQKPALQQSQKQKNSQLPMRSRHGKIADDTGSRSPRWRLTTPRQRMSAVPQTQTTNATVIGKPVLQAAVAGEKLFAIDSDLDQLFEFSPVDATSSLVGSTAAGPATPASLAFDGVNMFTIDLGGGGLYKLDLNTGAPTLVCSTGISGWQGVASDPTDEGQFYGVTQSDDLYKIDRTTCTTTQVNATAGTVGGLIAALEFDANGTLWGAEFGSPGSTSENAALVTIDKTTGAVTVVSQCATKPCSGSDNFADGFQGIDFSTDGTLYGLNTNDDSLYIIDTTDGSLTFLGSNGTIFVKGLAFSEEIHLQPGFSVLTLPAVGTLSYVEPLTGLPVTITTVPQLLPTEQVVYTPPTGQTGEPLASFTFEQSNGVTSDTGLIELFVMGVINLDDPCAAVGRPPGCTP